MLLEYLLKGNSIFALISFIFPIFIGYILSNLPKPHPIKYYLLLTSTIIVCLIIWIHTANQEMEKDKPNKDYGYFFVPEAHLQEINDGKIRLWRNATGYLSATQIAYATIQDYYAVPAKPQTYIHSYVFREAAEPSHLVVPIGFKYRFDIDQPQKNGRVGELLEVYYDNNGRVIPGKHVVWYKEPHHQQIIPNIGFLSLSTLEMAYIFLVCISFILFIAVLAFVSNCKLKLQTDKDHIS